MAAKTPCGTNALSVPTNHFFRGCVTALLEYFTHRAGTAANSPASLAGRFGRLAGLLLACASLVPDQAQAQDTAPVWSSTMTVGESTTEVGFFHLTYGDLENAELTIGNNEYFVRYLSIRAVDASTSSYFGFAIRKSSGADSIPTLADYTLEVAGAVVPLADANSLPIVFNDSRVWISESTLATVAPSLSLANYATTLPVGTDVPVCLRTATQVCPGGSASTDATLKGLALTDRDGNAVAFDEMKMFASDEYEYVATVPNAIDQVTVTPTKNHSAATVAFTPSTDATGTTDGHQVNLAEGENTIVLTVTAQDTTTMLTYTVTVTRQEAFTCDALDFTDRTSIWTSTLEVGVGTDSSGNSIAGFDRRTGGPGALPNFDDVPLFGVQREIEKLAIYTDDNRLEIDISIDPTEAGVGEIRLHVCGEHFDFADATTPGVGTFVWDVADDYNWTAGLMLPVALSEPFVNSPPTVENEIPDQTATTGTAFSHTFPDTTFNDSDTGDTLTYTATLADADDSPLPAWLVFDAGTRTFSGTPAVGDLGIVTVRVTAHDANGGTVSDEFDIDVMRPPGVTLSETALTVTEEDADGDTYTVVLHSAPTAQVTVAVSGHSGTDVTPAPASLTFTTTNWDTPQTVTVTAGDDADLENDSVTLQHTATSTDSDYDNIPIDDVSVTVQDSDTAQVTGLGLTAGNAQLMVYWTAVSDATGYQVQWKSGSQSYNNTRRAVIGSGTTASYTITGLANGTEYTVRVWATRTGYNDGAYSTEEKATPLLPTAAGVTLSKTTLTVTEEDTAGDTYMVVLDTAPAASVTITIGGQTGTDVTATPSPMTFTTTNWSSPQTVTVTAGDDADTVDDSVTLTHTAASTSPVYAGIAIDDVSVTVEDNDTARVTGLGLTAGNAQLMVYWTAVSNATGYQVQWKSGSQNYNNARRALIDSGTTTSYTIAGLANGTEYTVRVRATRTGYNNGAHSTEEKATPVLPTAAGVTLSKTTLTVTEEDATGDTYMVVLDTAPTASVTITIGGQTGTDVTATPSPMTFTTTNWSSPQTVTVTAGDDADTVDDSVTLTHTAASTSPVYASIAIDDVSVTVEDNDTAKVTGVTVTEGNAQLLVEWSAVSNATGYWVQWKSGSQNYSNSRGATISSGSTTSHTIAGLANGTEYTVRVRATRTGFNDGTHSDEVMGTPVLPTAAGVTLSKTALTVTEEDTAGDTYTVVLDSAPTASVTITIGGQTGTDVTATPSPMTFTTTNWDTAQTVTVTAGDDADTVDDSVTLQHTATSTDSDYGGIAIDDVSVTVEDNDTAKVTGVTVTAGNAQLEVEWTAVSNATGYQVQWKSGSQNYSNSRGATISSGSTTSHTIAGLANGTEYTVRVRATRTGFNDGAYSTEKKATPVGESENGDQVLTIERVDAEVTEGRPVRYRIHTSVPTGGWLEYGVEYEHEGEFLRASSLASTGGSLRTRADKLYVDTSLPTIDDGTVEADGSVTVRLLAEADGSGKRYSYTIGTPSQVTVRILDNDSGGSPMGAAVSVADTEVERGPGAAITFQVRLDAPLNATATVDWQTLDGSGSGGAKAGRDYEGGSGTLTFSPGQTLKTVRLKLLGGSGTKTMLLMLRNPVGAVMDNDGAVAKCVIRDPVAIDVADAEVEEGAARAALKFAVTLDRRRKDTVSVDYATRDGSATAGADYTATRGRLSFRPGETFKWVEVAVLDDSHNEGAETMALRLSNPSGAGLSGGAATLEATGTITNTDPMPAAWIARLGRAASDNVIEAVSGRWQRAGQAPAAQETHFTFGGRRMDGPWAGERETPHAGNPPASTGTRTGESAVEGASAHMDRGRGAAPAHGNPARGNPAGGNAAVAGPAMPGIGGVGPSGRGMSFVDGLGIAAGTAGDARWAQWLRHGNSVLNGSRTGWRELLMNSSFHYSPNSGAGEASTGWLGDWAVWGETAATRFSGAEQALGLKGGVGTAAVGFDSRRGRWLTGVALSYTEADGSYSHPSLGGGILSSALTGLHPYAHFEFNERTQLWGVLGYGGGDLVLTPRAGGGGIEAGLAHTMAALGGRTALGVAVRDLGRFELAVRADARFSETASEAVSGLRGALGSTSRVRALLEGKGTLSLAGGALLTPTIEAGLRYDGGDAETGAGLEMGAGLGYAMGRIAVRVNARGLLAHEDAAYEEWGYSASVSYRAGARGRGLSLQLGSVRGQAQSGLRSLWSRPDAALPGGGGGAMALPRRLSAQIGYGFDGPRGAALWRPILAVESGAAERRLRFGLEIASEDNARMSLEIGRRELLSDRSSPEVALQLQGSLRW